MLTTTSSHYCEAARWSLQYAGVGFVEESYPLIAKDRAAAAEQVTSFMRFSSLPHGFMNAIPIFSLGSTSQQTARHTWRVRVPRWLSESLRA